MDNKNNSNSTNKPITPGRATPSATPGVPVGLGSMSTGGPRRLGAMGGGLSSSMNPLGVSLGVSQSGVPVSTRRVNASSTMSIGIKSEPRSFVPNVNVVRRAPETEAANGETSEQMDAAAMTMALLRSTQQAAISAVPTQGVELDVRRRRDALAQMQTAATTMAVRGRYGRQGKRAEGKSKPLADVSWDVDTYAPVSLPFVERIVENEGGVETDDKKKSRPKMKLIDEKNRRAAHLFEPTAASDDGWNDQRHMLLMQFPTILPQLAKAGAGDQLTGPYKASSLEHLPSGAIGKMKVHKSGRVTLTIGGVPFRVDQGAETNFAQQAVATVHNAEMSVLGPILNKAVVTPDVVMLTKMAPSNSQFH